jgi:hypothetical protein
MPERTFEVQSSSGPDGLRIIIEDESSCQIVARLNLTPEQAYNLLRGTTMTLTGTQTDRLDRIGKRMVNEFVEVPDSVFNDAPYGDRERLGRQWAQENAPGWDVYEARRTNAGGVRVVMRKWVTDHTNADVRNAVAGLYGSVEG